MSDWENEYEGEEEKEVRERRRLGRAVPWWLIVGGLVGAAALIGGLWWVLFASMPAPPPTATPTPLPPSPTPTATVTPIPTATPQPPTPAPPTKITIGGYVMVTGVGDKGLSYRSGPGLSYARLKIVDNGEILKVLGGPVEAEGHTWWRLEDKEGVVGWAAEDWLKPTLP